MYRFCGDFTETVWHIEGSLAWPEGLIYTLGALQEVWVIVYWQVVLPLPSPVAENGEVRITWDMTYYLPTNKRPK